MAGLIADPPVGETAGPARRRHVARERRRYNRWVADQTLEDYALRFTAQRARRWSPAWVANTAIGSIAFLACEAIGATTTIAYGFDATLVALIVASAVFLIGGITICYYGARHGLDMDLLTRGAGFGYLGSTITSAVYAGFTFILFAIEALILSAALQLCLGLPLPIAHVVSALAVLPIAAYGFQRISRWQNWTQPLWLLLQAAPLVYLLRQPPSALAGWTGLAGIVPGPLPIRIGLALAVLLSLLPQIGEQVDYLRFLPARETTGRRRWWSAVLVAGPGWILIGAVKIMIGSALAALAVSRGMGPADAVNPTQLYYGMFADLLGDPRGGLLLTGLFVALCQTKINVTNAYAGSIASSNFFARLTHRHPGRVVWLIFNVLVALLLMESGIQQVIERVLAFYSLFAVAWFGAVVADLAISKPLGLSPPGIEFKRAHLYDVNPVGVGAMFVSLAGSALCLAGTFGPTAQALAPIAGLVLSFATAPLLAWATGGRYYIARRSPDIAAGEAVCIVCEHPFEHPDLAHCPVYAGTICSLCCTLEARCHDVCKEDAHVGAQAETLARRLLPPALAQWLARRTVRVMLILATIGTIAGGMLTLVYLRQAETSADPAGIADALRAVFVGLLIFSAFVAWYLVLAQESQGAAEDEAERQTARLIAEIEAHGRTDAALLRAREVAEAANLAKSRYIVGVSHEIRAPLSTISGYAQLIEQNPAHLDDAVRVIRRSAAHLNNLIDGIVDISRIENGSIRIERERVALGEMLDQIVDMFRLQAAAKGLVFEHDRAAALPSHVFTDGKRLRQILINLVGNAVKYTHAGSVEMTARWRNPVAEFEIRDTGVGIATGDRERIFEPFERIGGEGGPPGIGLGLTITRLLVQIMGADLTLESTPGAGSSFRLKIYLSEAPKPVMALPGGSGPRRYEGPRRRILAADDDPAHLGLIDSVLAPLGFDLAFAGDGAECLDAYRARPADLVMLDIAMPRMDGWQAARALRTEFGDGPVILMVSANVHDFQRARREDDPHDDYLIKPFELTALVDRIGVLLDLRWTNGA